MKAAQFREIGEALFGPRWHLPMAKALGVHPRTVRYWATGDYPIIDAKSEQIKAIVEERRLKLDEDVKCRRQEFDQQLDLYRQTILSLPV